MTFRIAVGGIRHESNTFSVLPTTDDDVWIERDPARLHELFCGTAPTDDCTLLPISVASALSSGPMRQDTYARLKAELLEGLRAALPVHGVCLDLHGALEVEHMGDGDLDLARAVREIIGPQPLLAISFDLHGNLQEEMAHHAQIMTAFRTAPHRDHIVTVRRAYTLLVGALRHGIRPAAVIVKLPLVLPGEAALTDSEPARSLYAQLDTISAQPGILDTSILIGYAWADRPYTSASVIAVAEQEVTLARAAAANLARQVWAQRHEFSLTTPTAGVDAAIHAALSAPERPVFLSDSGDNVTAGASGDSALLAEQLILAGAQDAVVIGLVDAPAVSACAYAGVGAMIQLQIGGSLDAGQARSVTVTGVVEHLGDTQAAGLSSPQTAVLRCGGVRVLLTRARRAFLTRADIASAGIEPMGHQVVVLKLGYLFPDLYDHAPKMIMVLSPGVTRLEIDLLPYRRLRRPIFPLDTHASWDGH